MLPVFIRNFEYLKAWYGIRFSSAGDIACGPGHFAAYLSTYGIPVFAADMSTAMIRLARRRYGRRRITFLVQDMRNLALPCAVDLLTCNFDSLNYLVRYADLRRALMAFRFNLNPLGHLIFDSITGVSREPEGVPFTLRYEMPGVISTWYIRSDPQTGLRTVRMCNLRNKRGRRQIVTQEVHRQRAWPIGLLADLLRRIGFRIKSIRAGDTLKMADKGTRRAVFIAQRRFSDRIVHTAAGPVRGGQN